MGGIDCVVGWDSKEDLGSVQTVEKLTGVKVM